MANKRFPADYSAGLATKLLGAAADGTQVYIVIPAGGDTLQSVAERGALIDRAIALGGYTVPVDFGVQYKISLALGIAGKGMSFGYNETVDAAFIGALHNSTGWKDIIIQPIEGNLGLGKKPTQKLDVAGNILASGSITPSSDKRLKKNIKNLPNALSAILELRPVTYTRKSDGVNDIGLIADEVREVFPDLVIEGKGEDKMLSLDYMKLTSPIISAIQELAKQNAELLARVEALEK